MKLAALAVVILVLGIVVGFALAGGASGGPVSAVPQCPGPSSQCPTPTPAPLQQREDQITIFSGTTLGVPPGTEFANFIERFPFALDPADYPSSSTFRLEIVSSVQSVSNTACVGLFSTTASAPVVASEACFTGVDGNPVRLRFGPFSLPTGEHEYLLQGKWEGISNSGGISMARIIVEWTE